MNYLHNQEADAFLYPPAHKDCVLQLWETWHLKEWLTHREHSRGNTSASERTSSQLALNGRLLWTLPLSGRLATSGQTDTGRTEVVMGMSQPSPHFPIKYTAFQLGDVYDIGHSVPALLSSLRGGHTV